MKKDKIVYLVMALVIAAGVLLRIFTAYHFFAGLLCGSTGMLLIFSSIGKWQANKAAKKIDEMVRQRRGY